MLITLQQAQELAHPLFYAHGADPAGELDPASVQQSRMLEQDGLLAATLVLEPWKANVPPAGLTGAEVPQCRAERLKAGHVRAARHL